MTWLHVVSDCGESVGADGTSKSVTNTADRQLLISARKQADWILVSADTFIAENYKASRYAPIAVVSSIPTKVEQILTSLRSPSDSDDLKSILVFETVEDFVFEQNLESQNRILLESGRKMAKSLAQARMLDSAIVSVTQPPEDFGQSAVTALSADMGFDPERLKLRYSTPELAIWSGSVEVR